MARSTGAVKIHDRNGILLSGIAGRRCRLQGLNDAQMYTGWVTKQENGTITIQANPGKSPNPGDFLFIEADAPHCIVTFVAYVTSFRGDGYEMKISSEVDERPLKNESRLLISNITGKLNVKGLSLPIKVLDVSENGIGFHVTEAMALGPCIVVVNTANGTVTVDADLRYCRKESTPNLFRCGVKILQMDRVSRARWARLMTAV